MREALARGWATTDLDRAVSELDSARAPGLAFEPADRSEALGARCLLGRAAGGRGWIVVMEPDREGRIAAFLARHGEGWAATWVEQQGVHPPGSGRASMGPLGPERLEPGSPVGPFRLSVAPATIRR